MKRFFEKKKRIIAVILVVILLVAFCKITTGTGKAETIKAALLYNGNVESEQYMDTYSQLQHSFVANFELEKSDAGKKKINLDKYDVVYLDSSVSQLPELKDKIVKYVENGGNVFLPNVFSTYFDLEFFGAEKLVKIDSVPTGLVFGENSKDISGLQEIIRDYSTIYEYFEDFEYLSQLDYGYGFIPDDAVSVADYNDISLYGLNNYGKGTVFYTNPLLPNSYHINGFQIEKRTDEQTHFTNSTATANQLILSEFASYVSKLKYGYSLKKVLGSFGNPAMAWQLHYEEITALQNNSAMIFGELCKEYNTIPSFTLIRNTYKWFLRAESVTYLLGDSDGKYHMDINENAYSSGKHVVEEDKFLSLVGVEDAGSYFVDNYNYMQMAYPHIGDFNKDGIADIISGSSDGKFYYFVGDSFNGEWKVKTRQELTDINGYPLSVGNYSSPYVVDCDNDGILDIISGNENGDICFFKGFSETHFYDGEILFSCPELKRTMPYMADVTKDGYADFIVGSVDGIINIYDGNSESKYELVKNIVCENETFVAPCVYDYNDDGEADIAYGTFDGYISKLKNNGNGEFTNDGYFDTEEMNYKGNSHIKFGNNCVPRFYDINGDNQDDMIAGELEYGLAIPIDSPYFKYRNELQSQVNYMKDNNYYLGAHFYTSEYSSADRENEELRLHKRAFDTYAIDYDDVGANMHTWKMSEFSPKQTLMSAQNAGFKWISCFRPTGSTASPDSSAEFSLVSPFFMDYDSKEFMATNASVLGYRYDEFAYMSAKYDLPVSEYYHCDFAYRDEYGSRSMIEKVVSYQKANNYNFVREDQLIKSSAAAYNMDLRANKNKSDVLSLKSDMQDKKFPLFDKDYQECTGIKIEFSDETDISKVGISANVWRYDEQKKSLYIGLDDNVKIHFNCTQDNDKYQLITSDASHIQRVNIPAQVNIKGNKATVKFEDDGMMQVFVAGEIKNVSDGWNAEYADGVTTVTKFGSESDLHFEFEQ